MSNQVPTYFVQEYSANVEMLLQQEGGKLRDAVQIKRGGGKAMTMTDQVGQVKPVKNQPRHSDTPLISTPSDRRWVYPTDLEWGDLIDKQDELRMAVQLESPYVQNGVNAIRRGEDDLILSAFFATAQTGENGTTATAFPGGQIIAANAGAAGNVGLTVFKMRQVRRLFMGAGVDVKVDGLYGAITSLDHDGLLGETQVINLDYNERPVLVEGIVDRFLGIKLIPVEFTDTIYDASATIGQATRQVPFWAKSGMGLAIWDDVVAEVSIRNDKRHAKQVYCKESAGSARLQERKVVQALCV